MKSSSRGIDRQAAARRLLLDRGQALEPGEIWRPLLDRQAAARRLLLDRGQALEPGEIWRPINKKG